MFGAYAINNRGEIAGEGSPGDSNAHVHAVVYSNHRLRDLGTVPGRNSSSARRINDRGQVIGTAFEDRGFDRSNVPPHGFLWEHGQMIDLAPFPGFDMSSAEDINATGQVVGYVTTMGKDSAVNNEPDPPRLDNLRAFLYSAGKMTDLNRLILANSGWVLAEADGINKQGQIVGTGVLKGKFRTFLLTPVASR
jgi:probable HAF family extracellular repeat protein